MDKQTDKHSQWRQPRFLFSQSKYQESGSEARVDVCDAPSHILLFVQVEFLREKFSSLKWVSIFVFRSQYTDLILPSYLSGNLWLGRKLDNIKV